MPAWPIASNFRAHTARRDSESVRRSNCAVRGELIIKDLTDARIPWPRGNNRRGPRSLVVYKDLARAVRRESAAAISYWFGVDMTTVTKWRKALGVPERNYGTQKLLEAALAKSSYVKGVKAGTA